jgi:hypothetical protein
MKANRMVVNLKNEVTNQPKQKKSLFSHVDSVFQPSVDYIASTHLPSLSTDSLKQLISAQIHR